MRERWQITAEDGSVIEEFDGTSEEARNKVIGLVFSTGQIVCANVVGPAIHVPKSLTWWEKLKAWWEN
jgi:hypothetical protein